jgi:hypothetical protein
MADRRSWAAWLRDNLVVQDCKGTKWPAGGGRGGRWKEPDGAELTVFAQGETFDVYVGQHQITNFALSSRTAVRLARWLLLWWVFSCWFGLKLWLWNKAQNRLYDERRDEEASASGRLDGSRPAG